MKDIDKLMVIAQTYSYINGSFTAQQLHSFIQSYNFKFHSNGFSPVQIGIRLSKSTKFIAIDERPVKYEAI